MLRIRRRHYKVFQILLLLYYNENLADGMYGGARPKRSKTVHVSSTYVFLLRDL